MNRVVSYSVGGRLRELVRALCGQKDGLTIVIYSKDRPAQLDLLIRSIKRFVKGSFEVIVIYKYVGALSGEGYALLKKDITGVKWIEEGSDSFRLITIKTIGRAKYRYVSLMVDDDIIIRDCHVSELVSSLGFLQTYSLRLGRNITWSYMTERDIEQPKFRYLSNGCMMWDPTRITKEHGDWAYAFSIDGDIIWKLHLLILVFCTKFSSPNTLESHGQRMKRWLGGSYICDEAPYLANVPDNVVQTDYRNRSDNRSVMRLNYLHSQGKRISIDSIIEELPQSSTHISVNYEFE